MRRSVVVRLGVGVLAVSAAWGIGHRALAAQAPSATDYRVLATTKTSTMEKELNEAAEAGFRFQAVMGGDTAIGGNEVVAVVSRTGEAKGRFGYKLLATTKTSTMEKELNDAGATGYQIMGMTVAKTAIGGKELVAILRRAKT
jgi:hypothetical protein